MVSAVAHLGQSRSKDMVWHPHQSPHNFTVSQSFYNVPINSDTKSKPMTIILVFEEVRVLVSLMTHLL